MLIISLSTLLTQLTVNLSPPYCRQNIIPVVENVIKNASKYNYSNKKKKKKNREQSHFYFGSIIYV